MTSSRTRIKDYNNLVLSIRDREQGIHGLYTTRVNSRLQQCKALYRRDLYSHYQCVNAIEFSDNGEYLVSGGDDKRVLLWKFGETLLEHGKPEQMQTTHYLNIFCLAITPDNTRIFSGGHDDRVLIHDVATKTNTDTLLHNKAVCCLSLDPFNSKIVATAGNDGRLLIFDTRFSIDESMVVSRKRKAFNSCAYHPLQSSLIAAANAKDGAALWDLRKPKHPMISYGGMNGGVFHNCMSVCFNKKGTQILALRRRQPPVLYTLNSADPFAHFYHADYFNSCTMKSCCFAGDNDEYVLSGSDDFNIYMWEIPDNQGAWVDNTHMILYGHRSIVNQVRYNPHSYMIASSGVEKIIKLWSPVHIPGCVGSLSEEQKVSDNPRGIYTHEDYVSLVHNTGSLVFNDYTDQSTVEDPRIMALFDTLVQRDIERWSPEDTDSQSDDAPIALPRNTTRNLHTIRLNRDSDGSSGSDRIVQNFLKRTSATLKNQRFPKRARLNITRYAKVSRIHQKGFISRRVQKFQRNPARGPSTSTAPTATRTRYLRSNAKTRRGLLRGSFLQSQNVVNIMSSVSDSDPDSDRPLSPTHRMASKMSRINRRRMSIPRNCKKRSRLNGKFGDSYLNNGNTISREESSYSEDNVAIPSTSTGFRGHQNPALFRIVETNSDDDISIDNNQPATSSKSRKHTRTLTYDNPDEDDPTTDDCDTLSNGETCEANNDLELDSPRPSTSWDDGYRERIYSSVLMRLRNETNESEVESSYSTEPPSPRKYSNLITPGSSNLPSCSKSTSNGKKTENDCKKQKCKMKRQKRNYRRQPRHSDTT